MVEMWQCPRCKAKHPKDEWASRYGIATCGRCLHEGFVILPETIMDTDDAMGLAMKETRRKQVNTDRVVKYLQLLAAEHIDGGFEDDERDYAEERHPIWEEMSQEERDTTNDLTERIFGEWL